MADATKISQGKPKVGGAVSIAPIGTALPTDATSELAETFKNLGYITTDGLTNSNSMETSDIKAWGGDTVMTTVTGKTDTFKCAFMESLNPEVLKLVYGDANVSGTDASTGLTVKSNTAQLPAHVIVVDMILKGDILKRIVIPCGTVTAVDDVVYKDDDVTSYGATISAAPDKDGNTHYEYVKAKPAAHRG